MAHKSWAQWYALGGIVAVIAGFAVAVVLAAVDRVAQSFPPYWIGVPLLFGALAIFSVPFVVGGWQIVLCLKRRG